MHLSPFSIFSQSKLPELSRSIRLLIAGTNEGFGTAVSHVITGQSDFEVVGTATSEESLLAEVRRLRPDVLLIGCRLLRHCSTKTVAVAKQEVPKLQVLAWSKFAEEIDNISPLQEIDGYLPIEISSYALAEVIRSTASKGNVVPHKRMRRAIAHIVPRQAHFAEVSVAAVPCTIMSSSRCRSQLPVGKIFLLALAALASLSCVWPVLSFIEEAQRHHY